MQEEIENIFYEAARHIRIAQKRLPEQVLLFGQAF